MVPDADPAVAIAVALLDQVPPDIPSVSVVVLPVQIVVMPVMGVGAGLTVIVVVR